MGRPPCCEKAGLKKGSWTPEEDQKLMSYIEEHGHGSWRALPAKAGLQRCGKSCRLRWTNYLRPDIKRGKFSLQEEQTIIQLHAFLGNRWSAIATHLPRRTDNEIKNYWNTHLKKRLTKMGIDPVTHKPKSYALASSSYQSNLSHMAQWESARLEAEARFVREYKDSSPARILPRQGLFPAMPTPPPVTLDVLNAWQGLWSASTKHTSPLPGSPLNLSEQGIGLRDTFMDKGEDDWTDGFEKMNKAAATTLPTGEDPGRIVDSETTINNDVVVSFPTFGEEVSDNAIANWTCDGVGVFYDNKHYWSNIITWLNSSPAYSLENV